MQHAVVTARRSSTKAMRPVARTIHSLNNRVFRRITRDKLRDDLGRLGLVEGDTVYANVSMRSLGYVPEGPEAVIAAIRDVVGDRGTVLMCAWPAPAPEVFDLRETPSGGGLLSEALRTFDGARRSLHPVGSVVAVGDQAGALTAGHEDASTPFGSESPLGRLMRIPSKLLLVGAHLGGLLCAVQDRVGYPNLYDAMPRTFSVRDASGRTRPMTTPVLRGLPPVIILPGKRPESRDYLLLHDYALMFPPEREQRVIEAGYLRDNRSRFLGRRDRLKTRGILASGRVGAAEAGLLDGARMLEQLVKDLSWDLAKSKEAYDPEHLAAFGLPVF